MTEKRSPAHNSTYPKGGVSCFADTFVVAESSVLRMNFIPMQTKVKTL